MDYFIFYNTYNDIYMLNLVNHKQEHLFIWKKYKKETE